MLKLQIIMCISWCGVQILLGRLNINLTGMWNAWGWTRPRRAISYLITEKTLQSKMPGLTRPMVSPFGHCHTGSRRARLHRDFSMKRKRKKTRWKCRKLSVQVSAIFGAGASLKELIAKIIDVNVTDVYILCSRTITRYFNKSLTLILNSINNRRKKLKLSYSEAT
jgi:hypothetical protein